MYSSQLSGLNNLLSNKQIEQLNQLLSSCTPNTKLNSIKISNVIDGDYTIVKKVIKHLIENDIVSFSYSVRCPICGLLISHIDNVVDIEDTIYCDYCEDEVEITSDDVEIVYTIKQFPFVLGQQHKPQNETVLTKVAALSAETLTQFLQDYDINKIYYCPTDQEYIEMQDLYNKAFISYNTTQEQGDAFEILCRYIFGCCKNYRAATVKTNPNQLDCYVRSKVRIVGTQLAETSNNIIVECKNESVKPSITYHNKIHSILIQKNENLGIIISRMDAPSTFRETAIKIYLSQKILIISLNKSDLDNIANHRHNLLEMIERKITEIKLDSKTDLVQAGLFDA